MGAFFGTDGIRGIACDDLTYDLAFRCGNALAREKEKVKIVIGRDTRTSGSYLINAFSGGAMSAGASIVDIGICPTPGIAYITQKLNADFGVVVSASHNPPNNNGIKIFDCNGQKLNDLKEELLERKFLKLKYCTAENIGNYLYKSNYIFLYLNFLKKCCKESLSGLKVVLDCSNGAGYEIAPKVFETLGADVVAINSKNDGANINNNCGALFPQTLSKAVISNCADLGFAFDGDADRIIACDENGKIFDGDIINYVLAKYLLENNELKNNVIVGTKHTNMAIENELKKLGINFVRTDIGDKYVIEEMQKLNASLGGEKSGHIILRDYITTGDGILTAIMLSRVAKAKRCGFSKLCEINLFPQENIDVIVKNKSFVIQNNSLKEFIKTKENQLGTNGRIMVRASGTEPKIRIMVEGKNQTQIKLFAQEIKDLVLKINEETLCVE